MKKIFLSLLAILTFIFLLLPLFLFKEEVFIFKLPPPQITKIFPKPTLPETEIPLKTPIPKEPPPSFVKEIKNDQKRWTPFFATPLIFELDPKKIIEFINEARVKNSTSLLKENQFLNQSAYLKAKEMLDLQYFAHESPSGKKLEDWLKSVGYSYLMAGENLAMGIFPNEKVLVDAWLQSPGHRENILNPRFDEIGVGLVKGNFQGKEVFLIVTHFAKPRSACPEVNEELKVLIEKNQKELEKLSSTLESLGKEIREQRKLEKIEEYNFLVEKYNGLLEETKNLVDKYNEQVRAFNECLSAIL